MTAERVAATYVKAAAPSTLRIIGICPSETIPSWGRICLARALALYSTGRLTS